MSEQRLLRIIVKHTRADGTADGNTVEKEYGDGFGDRFLSLIRKGYIDNNCQIGEIMLSSTGRYEAGS